MSTEQDKHTVPGLQSEVEGRGGEVPPREMAGDVEDPPHGDGSPEQEEDASAADGGEHGGDAAVESDEDPPRGDASPEQEDVSAADCDGHADATAEGDEEEYLKEATAEESVGVDTVAGNSGRGAALGSAVNEDHEVPGNQMATRLRFRAAIANPTPPTTYRRLPLRGRKQYNPTRFVAAGAAGVDPAMPTADQGDMNEAQGSTVTCSESDASVDKSSSDDGSNGTDATNAAAPTSCRPASRSRKQRRPDRYIPEEAEASFRAKARRSNAVLDRFLTYLLAVPPERRPEWVRNVTADDDRGQGQGQPEEGGGEPERVRNVTADDDRGQGQGRPEEGGGEPERVRNVTADDDRGQGQGQPEEGGGERDGRSRFRTVVAILGASVALSVVSCVLIYIVGKRTEHGSRK